MTRLPKIDADSHVEECEATWQYLDQEYEDRRPINVNLVGTLKRSRQDCVWLIDGRMHPRVGMAATTLAGTPVESTLSSKMKPFSPGSQTLEDIDARVRDLDKMDIASTVLFPTLLLSSLSPDPYFDAALIRSYNTWLAERCGHAPDRLKWAAVLPMRNVDEAVKEARRAKEMGATTYCIFGTAGEKLLHHRSLDPVWEEIARQDLPICIHVGWSFPPLMEACSEAYESTLIAFTLPSLMGFFSFAGGGILDRFPDLRVAILEAGGDWLPYVTNRMTRYYFATTGIGRKPVAKKLPHEYLKTGNIYLSIEGDDQLLLQVLDMVGEDAVMASADMPHLEERENCLAEVEERTDLSDEIKEKILTHNPARFFRIPVPQPVGV